MQILDQLYNVIAINLLWLQRLVTCQHSAVSTCVPVRTIGCMIIGSLCALQASSFGCGAKEESSQQCRQYQVTHVL